MKTRRENILNFGCWAALASMTLVPGLLLAGQSNFSSGKAAMPWLKMTGNTRSAGMGGAGDSTGHEVNALLGNPAGLARLQGNQASLQRNMGAEDVTTDHIAVGTRFGSKTGAAIGVDRINYGSIETFNVSNGKLTQGDDINPGGYSVNAGLARMLGLGMSAGATVRVAREDLGNGADTHTLMSFGADWHSVGNGIVAGLAVQNLPAGASDIQMPTNWSAGLEAATGLGKTQSIGMSLQADIAPYATEAANYSIGGEWSGFGLYALRGGYNYVANEGAGGFSAGGSVSFNWFRVDYAYLAQGLLGNAHQVSLSSSF